MALLFVLTQQKRNQSIVHCLMQPCFNKRFAIPYHTMPCHTMPYQAISCHAIPYHTMPCHTIPCHVIPYHTIPYHTIHPPTYLPCHPSIYILLKLCSSVTLCCNFMDNGGRRTKDEDKRLMIAIM